MKRKVILCGTHPDQYNGYSKVMFELSKELSTYGDIELYIFGFQNFYKNTNHKTERSLPNVKEIYDAHDNENPKAKGFGETLIKDFVIRVNPDIIIVYNDLVVITNMIKKIKEIPNPKFKLVPYIDIVYKNEKNHMIKFISDNVDGGIMFTEHWNTIIKTQGFDKPLRILEHGFNKDSFYPIPTKIARKFYNIDEKCFVIVNLNRNQPRKRWDICLMAYIKFIKTHLDDNIKLMIATSLNGGWDLVDIMHSECRKNGITFEQLKQHLIIIQNPQQVTDREINIMYNVGNIGINTCDGEGFGLCNFEQAGVGVPQIVPKIGGFLDVFHKSYSIMISPQWSYYTDHSRDFVSGEAEVCNVDDFVDALEFYYNNMKILKKYGEKSRETILDRYPWSKKGKQFYDIIIDFTKEMKIDDPIEEKLHNNTTTKTSKKAETTKKEEKEVNIDDHPIEEKLHNSTKTSKKAETTKKEEREVNIDELIEEKLRNTTTTTTTADDTTTKKVEKEVSIDELIEEKLNAKLDQNVQNIVNTEVSSSDDDDDDDDIIVIDGGQ